MRANLEFPGWGVGGGGGELVVWWCKTKNLWAEYRYFLELHID